MKGPAPRTDRWREEDRGYPTPCHVWQMATDRDGYGWDHVEGRIKYAHRLAYECAKGPIPEGLQIDHLCRVPSCVNPDHLEAVTPRENRYRGNGIKLTDAQVEEIRASAESSSALGARYGTSARYMRHIKAGTRR